VLGIRVQIMTAAKWEGRDLPLLHAAAERLDEGEDEAFGPSDLADETGLSRDDCRRAGAALVSAGYLRGIDVSSMGNGLVKDYLLTELTEKGRRAVGMWPSADAGEALIAALRDAAEHEPDMERRGLLRKATESLEKVGTGVLTGVVTAAINGTLHH
jgi:hypothetical protein